MSSVFLCTHFYLLSFCYFPYIHWHELIIHDIKDMLKAYYAIQHSGSSVQYGRGGLSPPSRTIENTVAFVTAVFSFTACLSLQINQHQNNSANNPNGGKDNNGF